MQLTARGAAIAAVMVIACGGHPPPAPRPVAPPPPARAIDLTDPLALAPANADFFLHVDGAVLRKSPLWTKYEKQALALFAPGFADCDYDPLLEMGSLTAGVVMADDDGVFVIRGLERDRVLACLRTSTAETATTVTFDGDYVTLTNQSGAVNLLTFPEPTTMVMMGSEHPTRTGLEHAMTIGAPLRDNAAYQDIARMQQPGAAVTFVFQDGAIAERLSGKLGAPMHGGVMQFWVTDDIAWRFWMRAESKPAAAAIADMLGPQLEQMRAVVTRAEAHVEGSAVVVEGSVTEAQILLIAQLVQQMSGGD